MTNYMFDAGGRLESKAAFDGAAPVVAAKVAGYAYEYDGRDRAKTETYSAAGKANAARAFAYDKASQVKSDGTGAYAYDEAGNRASAAGVNYTPAPANRVASDGVWDYAYDFEGNRVGKSKADAAGRESWEYTYDHRDQLVRAVRYNAPAGLGAPAPTLTADYTYDVYGNLLRRTVADGNAAPVTTRYAYRIGDPSAGLTGSANALWAELDKDGEVQTRYMLGAGGEALARSFEGAAEAWLLSDRIGSVRDVTSTAGGLVKHVDYSAFGVVTGQAGPGPAQAMGHLGYAGYFADEATGLNWTRWRVYDSATGQMLTEDPAGFAAGDSNVRRYVGNNASNVTDPSGLFWGVQSIDKGPLPGTRIAATVEGDFAVAKQVARAAGRVYDGMQAIGGVVTAPVEGALSDYDGYRAAGGPRDASAVLAIIRNTPVLAIVLREIEKSQGRSAEPGRVGTNTERLTAGDRLGRDVASGVELLTLGILARLSKPAARAVASQNAGPSAESVLRAAMKKTDTTGYTNAMKGALGEARTALTMRRAGYEELPARLSSNNGFDGVWIKRAANGDIADLMITESKFASDGLLRLTTTKTMGRQMSAPWIDANIQRMLNSADPAVVRTGQLLDANRSLIRGKAAVLDPEGVLRFSTP